MVMAAPAAGPAKSKTKSSKKNPALYQRGVFLEVPEAKAVQRLADEASALSAMLATIKTSGKGLGEQGLLDWFGENVYRTALLAVGTKSAIPSHVARELRVGNFRADFAWISLTDDARPMVALVELEGALESTLFHKKPNRDAPYIGAKFLEGFSQLVDWCAFGKGEAESHAGIARVLRNDKRTPLYNFTLVAGSDYFLGDKALEKRMIWWHQNVKLGDDTTASTYEDISSRANANTKIWAIAKP